jgi:hypothetical protein
MGMGSGQGKTPQACARKTIGQTSRSPVRATQERFDRRNLRGVRAIERRLGRIDDAATKNALRLGYAGVTARLQTLWGVSADLVCAKKNDAMANAGERGVRSPRCRQFHNLQRGSIAA